MSDFLKPEVAQLHFNQALYWVKRLGNIPEREVLSTKIKELEQFIGGEPKLESSSYNDSLATLAILNNCTFAMPNPNPKDTRSLQVRNKVGGSLTGIVGSLNGLQMFLTDEGDDLVDDLMVEISTIAPKYPITEEQKTALTAEAKERFERRKKK
jgi:hypothetical protein